LGSTAVSFSQTPNASSKILLLTDSHGVSDYSFDLIDGLENHTQQVRVIARCGGSPNWWFNRTSTNCGMLDKEYGGKKNYLPYHEFKKLNKKKRQQIGKTPDLNKVLPKDGTVILTLGTNMVTDFAKQEIPDNPKFDCQKKRLSQMAGTYCMAKAIEENGNRCIWIGPPNVTVYSEEAVDKTYKMIAALAPNCNILDSRTYLKYSGSDGKHYTAKGYKKWAAAALADITLLLKSTNGAQKSVNSAEATTSFGRSAE